MRKYEISYEEEVFSGNRMSVKTMPFGSMREAEGGFEIVLDNYPNATFFARKEIPNEAVPKNQA